MVAGKTLDVIKTVRAKPATRGGMAKRWILGEVPVATCRIASPRTRIGRPWLSLRFAVTRCIYVGVLKNSAHPNVEIFCLFWRPRGRPICISIPPPSLSSGTDAYKFAQGKQVIYMKQDQADKVDKISRQIGKILGFD